MGFRSLLVENDLQTILSFIVMISETTYHPATSVIVTGLVLAAHLNLNSIRGSDLEQNDNKKTSELVQLSDQL